MALLVATPDIIVVDKEAGATSGSTDIQYTKEREEELWERLPGAGWTLINVHVRTGKGDEADLAGEYSITLKPGLMYEVGIFEMDHGPLSTDPNRLADLKVFCLWKKPEDRALITDENRGWGGTWYRHQVATKVPTNIVLIGVSQKPPTFDSNALPRLTDMEGAPTAPLSTDTNHVVEINPLAPGNRYFFAVVVADAFGNWDVRQDKFTTLRRKLTVQFPTLHIYNDGDPFGHGEGEFWFRVSEGGRSTQEFHLPTQDIDDWSETDRPYPLGFAYLGVPKVIERGEEAVTVFSWGLEHDGFLESDEAAQSFRPAPLPLPVGQGVETVINKSFLMDCPVATSGDDFHYGVEVQWSVEYTT
jgi:hypothetical protein